MQNLFITGGFLSANSRIDVHATCSWYSGGFQGKAPTQFHGTFAVLGSGVKYLDARVLEIEDVCLFSGGGTFFMRNGAGVVIGENSTCTFTSPMSFERADLEFSGVSLVNNGQMNMNLGGASVAVLNNGVDAELRGLIVWSSPGKFVVSDAEFQVFGLVDLGGFGTIGGSKIIVESTGRIRSVHLFHNRPSTFCS